MYNSLNIPSANKNLRGAINTFFGKVWESPVIDKVWNDLDFFLEEGVSAKEGMMGNLSILDVTIFFDKTYVKFGDTKMSTDKIFNYFLKTFKEYIDKIETTNENYDAIYMRCVFKNFIHVKRYDKK